jgi:signal recognition particle subunit SRP54
MFELLSEKLNDVFGRLGKRGRLTEKDIDAALRDVRMALLEADVNFRVARDFVARIRERVLQADLLTSINPGQQVVNLANEELVSILGGAVRGLDRGPVSPGAILMIGLNGSGKTTSAAKLALHLRRSKQEPVLIAADVHRPAAVQQLEALGRQVNVAVYQDGTDRPAAEIARDGLDRAAELNAAWAIVDTAGRFQMDEELMAELDEIEAAVSPSERLLVVDAMTGQDAVRVAEEFHERIKLTGLILTKMDGDARGGAALSITSVTGVPVKFIGSGERIEALEQFHPDRLASRILGMGDMLTLIEKAQATFDQEQAANLERKLQQATFDLEDFLGQLQQLKSMGPLSQIVEMIPGFSAAKRNLPVEELDDSQLKKVEALIYSMTPEERRRPEIIGGRRRRRIARGSGCSTRDVNQLLNQFRQMQKLTKQLTSGKGRHRMARALGGQGFPFNL